MGAEVDDQVVRLGGPFCILACFRIQMAGRCNLKLVWAPRRGPNASQREHFADFVIPASGPEEKTKEKRKKEKKKKRRRRRRRNKKNKKRPSG